MTDLPPPAHADHVRFKVFTDEPDKYTPGDIAQATGLHPDQLGMISIEEDCIILDVHKACKPQVRDMLRSIGGCKLLHDVPWTWAWLRISVGRNHGLTMPKLRRVLEGVEAQPVGRIHLNNTYTIVGIREDRWDHVVASLADQKINGIATRPCEAADDESRGEDPRYVKEEMTMPSPRPPRPPRRP